MKLKPRNYILQGEILHCWNTSELRHHLLAISLLLSSCLFEIPSPWAVSESAAISRGLRTQAAHNCGSAPSTQNLRVVWVGRTFKDHTVQLPQWGTGTSSTRPGCYQVESHIQLDHQCFQGWGTYPSLWETCSSVSHHPHHKKISSLDLI